MPFGGFRNEGELGLRGIGARTPATKTNRIGHRVRNPSVRKGRAIECEVHGHLLLLRYAVPNRNRHRIGYV